ncbi:MAG: S-layer family protein, partial [Synechococcales bacterium]|nr:S-layer family protein [Synechococcales bacterium]
SPTGLRVHPGKTLALVGGEINLAGGILTAPAGQLELGSVGSGLVNLQAIPQGWQFTYEGMSTFQNISLTKAALLDSTGNGGGTIRLQGKRVDLTGNSLVFSQNNSAQTLGRIQVNASEAFTIAENGAKNRTRLWSETGGRGQGVDIVVNAPQVSIRGAGVIGTWANNLGKAGTINIQASQSVQLESLIGASQIASTSYNTANAGDIFVTSPSVRLLNGGLISSATFGRGAAGNVTVHAADQVEVSGVYAPLALRSGIGPVSFAPGPTGDAIISTRKLTVADGGQVGTFALAGGSAGNVTIHASESVEVKGQAILPGAAEPLWSRISAAVLLANQADNNVRSTLPSQPSGTSGNVMIQTPFLNIHHDARVTAENYGTGKAGMIDIQSNIVRLSDRGQISAATASGGGGDIDLRLQDLLQMRYGSFIAANAGGSGNGGNISIYAPVILGLENSDIIANAFKGRGGNIDITTQSVIGLKFRNTLTPRTDLTNDITASSAYNVNGTVQIHNIGIDPNSGFGILPTEVVDSSQQIANSCQTKQGSRFIATGRGGITISPSHAVMTPHTWQDLRASHPTSNSDFDRPLKTLQASTLPEPAKLVEATTWQRNPHTGEMELGTGYSMPAQTIASCSG